MSTTHAGGSVTRSPEGAAGGENFVVAPLSLPGRLRSDLLAVYAFARLVDDIGDEPGADGPRPVADVLTALGSVRGDLDRALRAEPVRIPALRGLGALLARTRVGPAPFEALIEANILDQMHHDYATRAELLSYCALSANPVGRLVLGVFGIDPSDEQRALSDDVCTALQIVEHLQDVREDAARGRVYLPLEDRRRFGVRAADLRAGSASPSLRALVAEEAGWAMYLLHRGSGLVGTLRGWPRLAVSGYVSGGVATVTALRRAGWDPLSREVRPRRSDRVGPLLRLLAKGRLP